MLYSILTLNEKNFGDGKGFDLEYDSFVFFWLLVLRLFGLVLVKVINVALSGSGKKQ